MPIQTATPEQVESCIMGLKGTIDRQAATIDRQAAEIARLREALEQMCSSIIRAAEDDSDVWHDDVRAAYHNARNLMKETADATD